MSDEIPPIPREGTASGQNWTKFSVLGLISGHKRGPTWDSQKLGEHCTGGWGSARWEWGRSSNLSHYGCHYFIHSHRLWALEKLAIPNNWIIGVMALAECQLIRLPWSWTTDNYQLQSPYILVQLFPTCYETADFNISLQVLAGKELMHRLSRICLCTKEID